MALQKELHKCSDSTLYNTTTLQAANILKIQKCTLNYSFIHSAISIAPLQVLYYSEALPTTARILYRSFGNRQLQVKDLPKVPTWRLERESNPRPSGLKSSSQPRRHYVPSLIFPQSSIPLY